MLSLALFIIHPVHADKKDESLYSRVQEAILQNKWDTICPLIQKFKEKTNPLILYTYTECEIRHDRPERAWTFLHSTLPELKTLNGYEYMWTRYIELTENLFFDTFKPKYWNIYESFLRHPWKFVRYYSAFRLSYWDHPYKKHALPVLREILETSSNSDLIARAQLAWYRISPQNMPKIKLSSMKKYKEIVRISVHMNNEANILLHLPLEWAKIWLQSADIPSLSDKAKNELLKKFQNEELFEENEVLLEIRDPKNYVKVEVIHVPKHQEKHDD